MAVGRVQPRDRGAEAAARSRQDRLTKPPGSLGRLEEVAAWLAGATGQPRPRFFRKRVVVLAADHGVVAEGVSAYPAAVTAQMVGNFLAGGAAVNVLARRVGAEVVVVDAGLATEVDAAGLLRRRIGPGTRNMARGAAMDRGEAEAAVAAGLDLADGADLVVTGEMGIGNTTAAAAVTAVLTGRPVAEVVGRGTGLDEPGLARKVAAVERALAVNRPDPSDPLDVLAKVGGFELGGLAGLILGAAGRRVPVVLDGFIAGAAALIAVGLCPAAGQYLVAAHRSAEPGHRAVLEALGLEPLLDLGMRLGEGSGALLALPLIEAAAALLDEMATFDEAGVSER